ncbi:MAG: hypothetical protein RL154_104, partial [Pseudomonadota bacterium]
MVSLKNSNEFLFILPDGQDKEICNALQNILPIDCTKNTNQYLISNTKGEFATIYAPEINWYLQNSNDSANAKAQTVRDIYELRAQRFDKNSAPINENISEYIAYNSSICNYANRFISDVCTNCVDVCPSNSLSANSITKNIDINPLLCTKCGSCIGVCPTGALESYEFKNEI